MEAHPSIVDEPMAVEATNESESAAAPQEPTPEGPARGRRPRVAVEEAQGVLQNSLYAHVHDFHCPKHVQSESLCVRFGESLSIVL